MHCNGGFSPVRSPLAVKISSTFASLLDASEQRELSKPEAVAAVRAAEKAAAAASMRRAVHVETESARQEREAQEAVQTAEEEQQTKFIAAREREKRTEKTVAEERAKLRAERETEAKQLAEARMAAEQQRMEDFKAEIKARDEANKLDTAIRNTVEGSALVVLKAHMAPSFYEGADGQLYRLQGLASAIEEFDVMSLTWLEDSSSSNDAPELAVRASQLARASLATMIPAAREVLRREATTALERQTAPDLQGSLHLLRLEMAINTAQRAQVATEMVQWGSEILDTALAQEEEKRKETERRREKEAAAAEQSRIARMERVVAERAVRHLRELAAQCDRLLTAGHKADFDGDYAAARALFLAASELYATAAIEGRADRLLEASGMRTPGGSADLPTALLSAANMAVKLGNYEQATSEFLSLLERVDLEERLRHRAAEKLKLLMTVAAAAEAETIAADHELEAGAVIDTEPTFEQLKIDAAQDRRKIHTSPMPLPMPMPMPMPLPMLLPMHVPKRDFKSLQMSPLRRLRHDTDWIMTPLDEKPPLPPSLAIRMLQSWQCATLQTNRVWQAGLKRYIPPLFHVLLVLLVALCAIIGAREANHAYCRCAEAQGCATRSLDLPFAKVISSVAGPVAECTVSELWTAAYASMLGPERFKSGRLLGTDGKVLFYEKLDGWHHQAHAVPLVTPKLGSHFIQELKLSRERELCKYYG